MADSFEELLDLSEFDGHSQVARFIHKDSDINTYTSTWEFVSYAYQRAFDELARKVFEVGRHRASNLAYPLFFLARHSIELELKSTIAEYAKTDEVEPDLAGHHLLNLWDQLGGYMERWGLPADDDWGRLVRRLLSEIQEADPRGDRFRYPLDIKGRPFERTWVEIEGLIRAHNSITTYLDGGANMHAEKYRG
ncbi:hypothetical protein [Bradyrhizobium guangdongense]|uniref:HEPN domain-containing protein n=1 Tax=Bradyrhizobium guangdongense TaxID=1325090 RepID=A0A410V717_9BRAD|nr:hypothetical protein [Bradyrhizobium guangdongense]QAU39462.1 hypothetical protein X265_18675 [Bradyrhizobium guangdongense]QOZ60522.1 hypothetical protein XH86_18685 [Bradyrhizobium guangdongense]GGI23831.1 hypothetical protein GCM10010987_26350 [Bradyrhizobium guangdongense]